MLLKTLNNEKLKKTFEARFYWVFLSAFFWVLLGGFFNANPDIYGLKMARLHLL